MKSLKEMIIESNNHSGWIIVFEDKGKAWVSFGSGKNIRDARNNMLDNVEVFTGYEISPSVKFISEYEWVNDDPRDTKDEMIRIQKEFKKKYQDIEIAF